MQKIKIILSEIEGDLEKLNKLIEGNLSKKIKATNVIDDATLKKISFNLSKLDNIIQALDEDH